MLQAVLQQGPVHRALVREGIDVSSPHRERIVFQPCNTGRRTVTGRVMHADDIRCDFRNNASDLRCFQQILEFLAVRLLPVHPTVQEMDRDAFDLSGEK